MVFAYETIHFSVVHPINVGIGPFDYNTDHGMNKCDSVYGS